MATPQSESGGTLLRVLIIIVALVLLIPLLVMVFMMPMMRWWVGGTPGSGIGMFPLWGLGLMLLFFLSLFGIGYLIYRVFIRGSLSTDDPALKELRLAYARGELSQDEFEQRQEDLRQSE